MPFKSEAQRRFLWMKHPDIARRWAHEEKKKKVAKSMSTISYWGVDHGVEISKSVLTAKRREKIKSKNFAYPGKKAYPIHDKAHARNALARAAQDKTSGSYEHVAAAVHRKYPDIGKGDD